MNPQTKYYQALYQEQGHRVFELYHHGTKVQEFPYPLETSLDDALKDLCTQTEGSITLHPKAECPRAQAQLEELAKRIGRSKRINGTLVWIGSALSTHSLRPTAYH